MGKYAHLNLGLVQWRCVPCGMTLETEGRFKSHCREIDVVAHRFCSTCNLVFPTLTIFEDHWSETHEFLAPLVSPEAARLEREIANEQAAAGLSERERDEAEERERQKKAEKKRLKAERKRQEAEALRQELESMGPVECQLCSREFATPGDYAQHLESGTHLNVKRHNVTQAVHMLEVIPPITLAPSIGHQASTHVESVTASSITPLTSVPSSPRTDVDGSWTFLGDGDNVAGPVVLASSVSTRVSGVAHSPPPFYPISQFDPAITYTPDDFSNLGIPYACALCFQTFRTVIQLTAHMNSPVHDPDAFKCPNPKCGRQFALVSGLIQHLESGVCKLASAGEIFERFALLTAKFSRHLAA